MRYIRVRWLQDDPRFPIHLLSELDDKRWETRKIEIFADGSKGYAANDEESGDTRLGLIPVPPDDEIAAGPAFVVEEISAEQFEAARAARDQPQLG